MKWAFWRNDWHRRFRSWMRGQAWCQPQDLEEARVQMREFHSLGLVDSGLLGMLEGVLNVDRMRVEDIMIPRPSMDVVPVEATREDILREVAKHGHSRYPVIDGDRGVVEGILLAKGLLTRLSEDENTELSIKDLMLPPHIVPKSKRLGALLKDFQNLRSHMAIVVNEYGEAAGLITIEDVLEEIVGEIEDEHDKEEELPAIRVTGDHHYEVPASVTVNDFNKHFNAKLDSEGRNTIGGLVFTHVGHLPTVDTRVQIDSFQFTVLRVSGRRIRLLDVLTKQPTS